MKVEYRAKKDNAHLIKLSNVPVGECFIVPWRNGVHIKVSSDRYFLVETSALCRLGDFTTVTVDTEVEIVDANIVWSRR